MQNYSHLAHQATRIIHEALEDFASFQAEASRIHQNEGRDIKLEADLFLHRAIASRLTTVTGLPCLSEEDLASHDLFAARPVWLLDPLDGSMNFSRGLPLYCLSLALWCNQQPEIGLVYDLARRQMYRAFDKHSTVNETLLSIGRVAQPEQAVLATGFPLLSDLSPQALQWFVRFAARFKKVRMLGSAALSLAWTAEGRLDAYFEKDIMLWDVAAGLALVQGAGGLYQMQPGRKPLSFDVLAANAALADEMRQILEEN